MVFVRLAGCSSSSRRRRSSSAAPLLPDREKCTQVFSYLKASLVEVICKSERCAEGVCLVLLLLLVEQGNRHVFVGRLDQKAASLVLADDRDIVQLTVVVEFALLTHTK